MEEKVEGALEKLGLTSSPAKVYVALLGLGEATVLELAEDSGIKRTTLYPILEDLEKAGFVHKTKTKKQTHYIAEQPSNIAQQIADNVEEFNTYTKELEQKHKGNPSTARVVFFDGGEGFKQIWRDIFASGEKEFLIITDPQEMLQFVKKNYITNKIISKKLELKVHSRQIIASSEYAKEIVAKDREEMRESKVLPHTFKIPMTTIIYGDSVALMSPASENTMLIVESPSFAKTQRSYFEMLWSAI